jgi:hypothetical protein
MAGAQPAAVAPPGPPVQPPYANIMWNGQNPTATAQVARKLSELTPDQLNIQATQLYTLLSAPDTHPLQLNAEIVPRVALVHVANSSKVKVVYSIGYGSSAMDVVTPLDDKVLCLTGDGHPTMGPPTPMCLPNTLLTKHEIFHMSVDQFKAKLTEKGQNYTYPLFPRNQATQASQIMCLAPIPANIVYDGFEGDLDAALVLERLMSIDVDNSDMLTNVQTFLLACLTSQGQNDPKPYVPLENITAPATAESRAWAKDRFLAAFPTLQPAAPAAVVAAPDPNFVALMQQMIQGQNANRVVPAAARNEEKDDETKRISAEELQLLLILCGKDENGDAAMLPPHFAQVNATGHSKNFKLALVRKHIKNNNFYDDADPPLTNTLLKMVIARGWAGNDGDTAHPDILNALSGLSPFLAQPLTKSQIAAINEADGDIANSNYTLPEHHKKLRSKQKVECPADGTKLVLLLKRFANLVYAIFGDTCPLFLMIKTLVDAIKEFSDEAREGMSKRSIASILWILLIQTRHFAEGELNVLPTFANMQQLLASHMDSLIFHNSVPIELYAVGAQEQGKKDNKPATPESPKKKPRAGNPNIWHEEIRKVMEKPLQIAGNPSFSKLMKFCGAQNAHLRIFSKGAKVCGPNAFLGRCQDGDACERAHCLPKDDEVAKILKLVKKFTDDPAAYNDSK